MFNSLRLSVVVTAEILTKVAAEVLIGVAVEITAVVLLMAVRY